MRVRQESELNMKTCVLFLVCALILVDPLSGGADSSGVVQNGLVSYYSFDAATALGNDSIANRNTGTANGASYIFPAVAYGGAWFDGVDDHISIPASGTFNLSAFTIAGWIAAENYVVADGNVAQVIFDSTRSDVAGEGGGLSFSIYQGTLTVAWKSSVCHSLTVSQSPPLFTDADNQRWHFVAVTYEDLGQGQIHRTSLQYYRDGKQFAPDDTKWQQYPTGSPFTACPPTYGNNPVFIGSNWGGAAGFRAFIREFHGAMDELWVYGRALTRQEIRALSRFE